MTGLPAQTSAGSSIGSPAGSSNDALADAPVETAAEALADDVIVHRNCMIPMRDGVRLATDIFRPAQGGQPITGAFPVIFERTPYDKAGTPRTELSVARPQSLSRSELAMLLVRQGYVVIWQDCRGRYGSEGHFTKYVNEAEDGFDSMVWITAQPFCSGRIGTMGLSYDAHVQMALACLNPPGLACMAVDWRLFQCLHLRHPSGRRLRDEAGDMGLEPRPGKPVPAGQSRPAAHHRRRGSAWLDAAHALDQGPLAGALGPRL